MSLENEVPLPERQEEHHSHNLLYLIVGIIVGAIVVVGLFAYSSNKVDSESKSLAEKLEASYKAAGIADDRDIDQVARTYGTSGGWACTVDQDEVESTVNQTLTSGAAGPGLRPVPADTQLSQSTILMAEVYCPDRVDEIKKYINDLDTDDTIKD